MRATHRHWRDRMMLVSIKGEIPSLRSTGFASLALRAYAWRRRRRRRRRRILSRRWRSRASKPAAAVRGQQAMATRGWSHSGVPRVSCYTSHGEVDERLARRLSRARMVEAWRLGKVLCEIQQRSGLSVTTRHASRDGGGGGGGACGRVGSHWSPLLLQHVSNTS